MPARESFDRVVAQEQREGARRILGMQRLQRRHRVAGARATDFAPIGDKPGKLRAAELGHRQACLCGCNGRRTMRRIARRNNEHIREIERCTYVGCEAQMSVMNGIECSTKDADRAHGGHRICRPRASHWPISVTKASSRPRVIPMTSIALEAAAWSREECELVRRRSAPEDRVTVRKASEPANDFSVALRPLQLPDESGLLTQAREQLDTGFLSKKILGMLKWHVEKPSLDRNERAVGSTLDCFSREA